MAAAVIASSGPVPSPTDAAADGSDHVEVAELTSNARPTSQGSEGYVAGAAKESPTPSISHSQEELATQLTVTESEASANGEDGDGCLEVEAFLATTKSLGLELEPDPEDSNMADGSPAAAVVSPSTKEDLAVERSPAGPGCDKAAPLVDVSSSSKDSSSSGVKGSPNSVAGMDNSRPISPEPGRVVPALPLKADDTLSSSDSSRERLDSPGSLHHVVGTYDATSMGKSSSMLDSLLEVKETSNARDVHSANAPLSEAGAPSVIMSDAGESKCTLTSTSPVINLAPTGGDEQDEKLVALSMFAKAATADGEATDINTRGSGGSEPWIRELFDKSKRSFSDPSNYATRITEEDDKAIKTATSGSGSESSTKEAEGSAMTHPKLGRVSPIDTSPDDKEVAERRNALRGKSKSPLPMSPNSVPTSGYDKKRLSERLKQRLAKRNQMHHSSSSLGSGSPTKGEGEGSPTSTKSAGSDKLRDKSQWETRLQARQKRRSKARTKSVENGGDGASSPNSDILARYGGGADGKGDASRKIYPDQVSFSDGEDEGPKGLLRDSKLASRNRRAEYRKCVSEVGASLSLSTRAARSKLSKHHHSHHHGIGILQADGIVYDDALLLRLARQAKYGRLRGEVAHAAVVDADGRTSPTERRTNDVKIHVYDLLTKDSLVEVPYFNCNFPIGQCFKVVNDGCHVLGTGAYHVGVEVNGVEYAFGANNIIGMSGIFTCVPRESPGYEYRETLDFGKQHTTKRTWIRIPKSGGGPSYRTISAAFGSVDNDDRDKVDEISASHHDRLSASQKENYSFREIETFADGHAVIHSMAREYMGTDYDLLRKNCCTFARDVCIRLGVREGEIPRWFHNAAQAGADAEDAITNVEESVRRLVDCAEQGDPLDMECYNHGFEVIMEDCEGRTPAGGGRLKVVESPPMRASRERKPLRDDLCDSVHETASWTY